MSSIEDMHSGLSSQGHVGGQYVLYVYPSAERGPCAEGVRPIIVFHRWAVHTGFLTETEVWCTGMGLHWRRGRLVQLPSKAPSHAWPHS